MSKNKDSKPEQRCFTESQWNYLMFIVVGGEEPTTAQAAIWRANQDIAELQALIARLEQVRSQNTEAK